MRPLQALNQIRQAWQDAGQGMRRRAATPCSGLSSAEDERPEPAPAPTLRAEQGASHKLTAGRAAPEGTMVS